MADLTTEIAEYASVEFPQADTEIIGAWVWCTFPDKPDTDTRGKLKEKGFRWSPRRGQWSHSCGVPKKARMKSGHPRDVYGSIAVSKPYERSEDSEDNLLGFGDRMGYGGGR